MKNVLEIIKETIAFLESQPSTRWNANPAVLRRKAAVLAGFRHRIAANLRLRSHLCGIRGRTARYFCRTVTAGPLRPQGLVSFCRLQGCHPTQAGF